MNLYQLWWACTKAILRGCGSAEVLFDTEAQCFDCHYVPVNGAELYEDTPEVFGSDWPVFALVTGQAHVSGHKHGCDAA